MQRIIDLLRQKNEYLHNFFAINENELLNFAEGNFENLEGFYLTRDKILQLVSEIDLEVNKVQKEASNSYIPSEEEKKQVQSLLNNKDELVREILAQDLQIISRIEEEKSTLIKEIQSVKKIKKAVQGYHSGNYNKHVDEKA